MLNDKNNGQSPTSIQNSADGTELHTLSGETEASNAPHASKNALAFYRATTNIITFLGMVSLGLLSALLMHKNSKSKGYSDAAAWLLDLLSFCTTVAGKYAITTYFCEAPSIAGLSAIFSERKVPDYLRVDKRNLKENMLWSLALFASIFSSAFWAGLVELSFRKSSELLLEYDNDTLTTIGENLALPAVYAPFVVSSFYANVIAWPGVFESNFNRIGNMPKTIREFMRGNLYSEKKDGLSAYRQFLFEVKKSLNDQNAETPMIDLLYRANSGQLPATGKSQGETTPLISVEEKLKALPKQLTKTLCDTLCEAEIETRATIVRRKKVSHSVAFKITKLLSAVAFTVIGTVGFENILGLNDAIWGQWGLRDASTYGGRYIPLWGAAEVAIILMPALVNNLLDALVDGMPVQIFSNKRLAGIAIGSLFVGSFSGSANAEQAVLNGGNVLDIITAFVASAGLDCQSLWSLGKAKSEISLTNDDENSLPNRFLMFKANYDPRTFTEEEENTPLLAA